MSLCKSLPFVCETCGTNSPLRSAKVVAALLVVLLAAYRGYEFQTGGGDTCTNLLSTGTFTGPTFKLPEECQVKGLTANVSIPDYCGPLTYRKRFVDSRLWKPEGCSLHHYSSSDGQHCFELASEAKTRNTTVLFVGDSRVRQIFRSFVSKVDHEASWLKRSRKMHFDIHGFEPHQNLHVWFSWRPNLNGSTMETLQLIKEKSAFPDLLVMGTALHIILEHDIHQTLKAHYANDLAEVAELLDNIGKRTNVLWMLQPPISLEDEPKTGIADPGTDELKLNRPTRPHYLPYDNQLIDEFNNIAVNIFKNTSVYLWRSAKIVAQQTTDSYSDYIHPGQKSDTVAVQLLLNFFCNSRMDFIDGTCCTSSRRFTLSGMLTFAVITISIVLLAYGAMVMVRRQGRVRVQEQGDEERPADVTLNAPAARGEDKGHRTKEPIEKEVFLCVIRLVTILGYFYVCDRANVFQKELKVTSPKEFWTGINFFFLLGLAFWTKSSSSSILNRDLTDEWKGWMQIVILVYHMTGMSSDLTVYMHLRIIVSSYLFMTGYGHFAYFWNKGDTALKRYLQVMFRLNFFTLLLCGTMGRDYMFYYFVPLVSFWYSVMYLLLTIPPHLKRTDGRAENCVCNHLIIGSKFLLLAACTTLLYVRRDLFEFVFSGGGYNPVFSKAKQLEEWWFRWKIDRYSLLYGMLFAYVLLVYEAQGKAVKMMLTGKVVSTVLKIAGAVLVPLCLGVYVIGVNYCSSKEECNIYHPYLTFIPIVGYVLLRNFREYLRSHYSTLFAWAGLISLELFVCQYHIWLAADTEGILILVSSHPLVNRLITTYIFVLVCHEVHCLTSQFTNFVFSCKIISALWIMGTAITVYVLIPPTVHFTHKAFS